MARFLDETSQQPSIEALGSELASLAPGLQIIATRALGSSDDAQDAVQEVLARALRAINEGRLIRGPLAAFVQGIAAHVFADWYRERSRTVPQNPVADPEAPDASPLELLIDAQEREAVRKALAQLDESDRALLRRCFVEGETVATIARAMNEPATRIRKRKSRALQRLRDVLSVEKGHASSTGSTTER